MRFLRGWDLLGGSRAVLHIVLCWCLPVDHRSKLVLRLRKRLLFLGHGRRFINDLPHVPHGRLCSRLGPFLLILLLWNISNINRCFAV